MHKVIIIILMLTNIVLGEIEVIPISSQLNQRTYNYFWPDLADGGIYIDSSNIYIADQNRILIQPRDGKSSNTFYDFNIHGKKDFLIKKLTVTKRCFYYTVFLPDGRIYLYKTSRNKNQNYGPLLKHGNWGRMFNMPNDILLVSGVYRPGYAHFLDLNDDEDNRKSEEEIQSLLYSFYRKNKAFTLAYYDSTLNLIDSLNVLPLSGETALAFDRLYLRHPIDITKACDIYLVDNSDGYTVKHFGNHSKTSSVMYIHDPSFVALPNPLTMSSLQKIRYVYGSFTQVYALAVSDTYILSSFYRNPEGYDIPAAPFYYDVFDLEGNVVFTTQLEYPLIAEDESNKIFLFVRLDEGWYKRDKLFLVGLTINDFLAGNVTKSNVDKAISKWKHKHD